MDCIININMINMDFILYYEIVFYDLVYNWLKQIKICYIVFLVGNMKCIKCMLFRDFIIVFLYIVICFFKKELKNGLFILLGVK